MSLHGCVLLTARLLSERRELDDSLHRTCTCCQRVSENQVLSHMCAQVEALQAVLEEERRGARARDARQRLAVERLRRQVVELQARLH